MGDFVEERFEGLLDVPVEFVRAARRSAVTELGQVAQLAQALAQLDDPALDRLHTAYSRADRLAGRSEEAAAQLNQDLLGEQTEIDLAREVGRLGPEIQAALQAGDIQGALRAAAELGEPVDRFFDEVLVMAEDSDGPREPPTPLLGSDAWSATIPR